VVTLAQMTRRIGGKAERRVAKNKLRNTAKGI
jgi:hypothetical protein